MSWPPLATAEEAPRRGPWRLNIAWPLQWMLVGYPLWWALGLAGIVPLAAATVMGFQILKWRRLRLPAGFGIWVLFLAWMLAGVFVLWVHAPGTVEGGGPERLIGFGYRVLWYVAATIMMLYPLAIPPRLLPSMQIARWLGILLISAGFLGLIGVFMPGFSLTSPMELIVPGAQRDGFVRTLVHPALTTASDFLGYEQPRPKAPFAYPNAWGNNIGLLVPFFVVAWLDGAGRLRRLTVPVVLALLAVPVAFSLNRGLWLGLIVALIYLVVILVRDRKWPALWSVVASLVVGALLLVLSPLWPTITLRLERAHSNERRETVALVVLQTTWEGSPLLGYGSTRKVSGNFESIAGGQTADCRQCAAPPLGTQGFMWRLVFTTGFVGTALFVGFAAIQFFTHFRRREPLCIVGSITIVTSGVYFIVYDSLELPMLISFLAIGLMNRERILTDQGWDTTPPRALESGRHG